MATTMRMPGEVAKDMDFDIARADMMTPFSLSLAAEKAIESAKRQLDAMDERLLNARMAMASVKVAASAGSPRTLSRLDADFTTRGWSEPQVMQKQQGSSSTMQAQVGAEDTMTRTIEMKKLRDDLRNLRSRMSMSRSVAGTMNLTPPRPSRPSAADIPDLQELERALAEQHFDLSAFPIPPKFTAQADMSAKSLRRPEDAMLDLPLLVQQQQNPFSPRPYSSLSIMEPLPIREPTTQYDSPRPFPQSSLKPFPKSSLPMMRSPGTRNSNPRNLFSRTSSQKSLESVKDAIAHTTTISSSHQRSSSSDTTYSDADTSIGAQTPAQSPSQSIKSSNQSIKSPSQSIKSPSQSIKSPPKSTIPRFKRHSGDSAAGSASPSQGQVMNDGKHQELISRVENLLHRISLLDAGTEEERRRRKKLQAALAILEDSEEE